MKKKDSDISLKMDGYFRCYIAIAITEIGKEFLLLWNRNVHKQQTILIDRDRFIQKATECNIAVYVKE